MLAVFDISNAVVPDVALKPGPIRVKPWNSSPSVPETALKHVDAQTNLQLAGDVVLPRMDRSWGLGRLASVIVDDRVYVPSNTAESLK